MTYVSNGIGTDCFCWVRFNLLQPMFRFGTRGPKIYKNVPSPASFSVFLSFQTNISIFTTNKYEKCPSSIWCQDSNPRLSEHESPPITTRPGLPPDCIYSLTIFLSRNACLHVRLRHIHEYLILLATMIRWKCHSHLKINVLFHNWCWTNSVTRLGNFLKFLATKFLAKEDRIIGKFFGYFENLTLM